MTQKSRNDADIQKRGTNPEGTKCLVKGTKCLKKVRIKFPRYEVSKVTPSVPSQKIIIQCPGKGAKCPNTFQNIAYTAYRLSVLGFGWTPPCSPQCCITKATEVQATDQSILFSSSWPWPNEQTKGKSRMRASYDYEPNTK